ncbi:MAG TPA: hypothetical protein VLR26_12485 [Frankiaceae bacterium]|nr:hypothetical protein [Frankiaceae bacterium]
MLSFVFMRARVPETKNRSLAEIERELRGEAGYDVPATSGARPQQRHA